MIPPWGSQITGDRNPDQRGWWSSPNRKIPPAQWKSPHVSNLSCPTWSFDVRACPRTRRRFIWLLKAIIAFSALWFLIVWLSSQHLPHETSSGTAKRASMAHDISYQPVSSKFGNELLGTGPPMKLTPLDLYHLAGMDIHKSQLFGVHQPTARQTTMALVEVPKELASSMCQSSMQRHCCLQQPGGSAGRYESG